MVNARALQQLLPVAWNIQWFHLHHWRHNCAIQALHMRIASYIHVSPYESSYSTQKQPCFLVWPALSVVGLYSGLDCVWNRRNAANLSSMCLSLCPQHHCGLADSHWLLFWTHPGHRVYTLVLIHTRILHKVITQVRMRADCRLNAQIQLRTQEVVYKTEFGVTLWLCVSKSISSMLGQ